MYNLRIALGRPTKTTLYFMFFTILFVSPSFREYLFILIFPNDGAFETIHDIIHVLVETIYMAFLAIIIIVLDIKFSRNKFIEIRETQATAIETLASLAEYRDAETGKHLQRISIFVRIIAKDLVNNSSFSSYIKSKADYIGDLANASILHDIGKMAISDTILLKPGKLTNQEFEAIKAHTMLGAEMLKTADKEFKKRVGDQGYFVLAQSIARSHHEKWDGTGYPDGLSGEDIPLAARIVAICDVYDSLTTGRVYKKAWSHNEAVELIKSNRGTHFDPTITDIFLKNEKQFDKIREEHK